MRIKSAMNINYAIDLEELQVPDWFDDDVEDAVEM